MKRIAQQENGQKAYMRLYHRLRSDIVSGAYPCGGKLPSKRQLAADSGVSVITVQHAYELLCDEGYAEARQRSGYFVSYRREDMLSSEPPMDISEALPLAHTHSPSGEFPFSVLARTMRRVLAERGEDILVKSPNHGCPELRGAIRSYLARSIGISVQPEQIIIGSGAEYLYSLIASFCPRSTALLLSIHHTTRYGGYIMPAAWSVIC